VVGAFGLLHGIDDALVTPEHAGQVWDAELIGNQLDSPVSDVPPELETDVGVAELAALDRMDVEFEGAGVPIYALTAVRGAWEFTVLEGRKPVAADEVVMGPASAKALGVHVGDTMRTADGRDVRIVGVGLLPQTPHFSFDQGGWVSAEGLDSLAPPGDGEAPRERTVLVRFPQGSSLEEGVAGLEQRFGHVFDVESRTLPQDVQYLRNVRPLPKALAAFLVLLGVGALGHVLTSTVRRRRRDLAVLRALGFRPLQVAGCVTWQAVTVSVVALVIGIPLGIAAGRWSWRWVADSTPLFYAPPLAAAVAVVSVPAALLLANAMAALPARRAARLRPADVLRAE
jgi:hypothetical protein